ncbi:MAG: 2Fe-2S iron-sulfur cluster-binding protein [Bacteroidota bacterium]
MIKIKVEDTNGTVRDIEIEVNPGSNLMEALVEEEFDVPAICGGLASCGTCHVMFTKGFEKLEPKEGNEEFMLDSLPNIEDTSRLACQLDLTEHLDGAEIKVLADGA